jgi:hypothetical protein
VRGYHRAVSETLVLKHAQGTLRYTLGGKGLNGGDIVELCCSGGWLTGRFEWNGRPEDAPRFHFSIELARGGVEELSITIPELALLRRKSFPEPTDPNSDS